MEQIDFSNTYFTTRNMIPEAGEPLSLLWGRKIVNNLANTYGIIGTCEFNGQRGYRSVNLQLTKKYTFAPSVYLYYTDYDTERMHTPIECHPTFGEYEPMISIYNTGNYAEFEAGEYREKVYSFIQNDNLIIWVPCLNIKKVFYRIVGV